jgi:hypothetical protein
MPKPRSGKSYRLSEDAQRLLARLADRLGLTRTGILEMAIRKLAYAELDEPEWPLPSPPPVIATPGGVDVEDPNVVLPPGLRGFRLSPEDAQTMRRLLDDPAHPTHDGKEMPPADVSVRR